MHAYPCVAEPDEVPAIFSHIERYLGQVNAYWTQTSEGDTCPFQVVRCAGRVLDTTFFCTLGLANHCFDHKQALAKGQQTGQQEPIRQELLVAVPALFGTRNVPPVLQQLGTIALNRNRPFIHGEVMQGTSPVLNQLAFRGFYACHPCVIGDKAFAECVREDGERVCFVWMAPLYEPEIEFVRKHGPASLEAIFAQGNIDLVDIDRTSAVH